MFAYAQMEAKPEEMILYFFFPGIDSASKSRETVSSGS